MYVYIFLSLRPCLLSTLNKLITMITTIIIIIIIIIITTAITIIILITNLR